MNYLGIDVHKRESQVAVLDEDGKIVDEVRVENANLEEIAREYAGSQAALEATSNYYTIYDTLDEYLDVSVANPSKTKLIADAKLKTDRVDAKQLAHLLRTNFLAESYVPPEEIRERRALVRGRKDLVEERSQYKNKIHGLLDQHGITYDVRGCARSEREARPTGAPRHARTASDASREGGSERARSGGWGGGWWVAGHTKRNGAAPAPTPTSRLYRGR